MDGLGCDVTPSVLRDDISISTQSETGTDGILMHENEELRDRVALLERKSHLQEDEIICLKSALSDCIRRMSALETGRASQSAVLPSKPAFKSSTPRKTSAMSGPFGSATPRSPGPQRRPQSATPSKQGVPRQNSRENGVNMKKWPSTPNTAETNGNGTPYNAKEPTFTQDDGLLRMYLRGRAISLYAPTDLEEYDINKPSPAPQQKLQLEWVYGYRGRDSRCNLYLLPTGEMVYYMASVVVLYNVEEQMQRHYMGHNDDVKCLAVHPDKITIATGQMAGHDKKEGKDRAWSTNGTSPRRRSSSGRRFSLKDDIDPWPHVRIWDSVSLNTLHVIGLGDFERAVACLAFSKSDGGQFLACVDEANEHVISLWDWQKGERGNKITETKSSTEAILAVEFHPCEKNIIVTCGKSHLGFWNLEGGTLTKKLGIYDKNEKPKFVTCMSFAENGDLITGDSNGNLFVWGREGIEEGNNRISTALTGAHDGAVFSICVTKDGNILSGGKDRKIIQWNSSYERTGTEHEVGEEFGPVRMLSHGRGGMVLVGTTKNCVLQGTLGLEFTPILQGHMDELWGMSCHPSQHQFLTCGYDRSLHLWDTLTHAAVWSMDLPDGAHSCCFHPEGLVAVVGTVNTKWLVIDTTTHEIVSTHSDGNEQIECVEFSPDGSMLAVGSRDNYIYVYSVTEGGRKYSRVGRCSGHSSFVTHLDWSQDSQFIQSNSGDYEVLFWNTTTCKQVTSASSLRDVEWATHHCTLGFNVCGIWPEGADGTDVNACGRSHKKELVATADDFGKVNLYSYPCNQPKSTSHTYGGHSSHVTNVRFIYDDSRMLSTGGKDMAILQWAVV